MSVLIIEKLLKEFVSPTIKILNSQSLGGGCINHAMKITTNEGTFFAKYNQDCLPDLFLREAECLEELEKASSSLIIPHVLVKTTQEGNDPAVLITEYLEPPGKSTDDYDERLGRGLAEIHRHIAQNFGFHHDNYCGSTVQDNEWNRDWIDFFGRQRVWRLVKLIQKKRGFSSQEMNIFSKLIEKLPNLLDHNPKPSLIHGDLWSGNYLSTAKGPAVIDPASYYADRECEFSIMYMFGGFSPRVMEAYQEVYPLTPEWDTRNELYMLYHYLNHHFLFGGSYGPQAIAIAKSFI